MLVLILIICTGCSRNIRNASSQITRLASEKCLTMSSQLKEGEMPRTFQGDTLVKSNLKAWTSGFFPGTCWYTYLLGGDEKVMNAALIETEKLIDPLSYLTDHDAGFQVMCSLGHAYKITGEQKYRDAIRVAAKFLAARYSPTTGVIKSWDDKNYSYPVIIDNMMNLELLTFAAREFGVNEWKDIAVSHADKTMKNHFREDASSYHLVDYNSETGEIVRKMTVQGYADDSAWARGQSWGLYGYTMMYAETGEIRYLEHAEKIAGYLMPLLKNRPVPAWDFNASSDCDDQPDASAAAVMASAFIQLSVLTENLSMKDVYRNQAESILRELSKSEYLATSGEVGGFILKRSTGFYKKNREVDTPLTYADYYFMEALYRYSKL